MNADNIALAVRLRQEYTDAINKALETNELQDAEKVGPAASVWLDAEHALTIPEYFAYLTAWNASQ